jgi:hypothetical protein
MISGYRPGPEGPDPYVSFQKKYRSRSMPTTSDGSRKTHGSSLFSYLNLRDCALISNFV